MAVPGACAGAGAGREAVLAALVYVSEGSASVTLERHSASCLRACSGGQAPPPLLRRALTQSRSAQVRTRLVLLLLLLLPLG